MKPPKFFAWYCMLRAHYHLTMFRRFVTHYGRPVEALLQRDVQNALSGVQSTTLRRQLGERSEEMRCGVLKYEINSWSPAWFWC